VLKVRHSLIGIDRGDRAAKANFDGSIDFPDCDPSTIRDLATVSHPLKCIWGLSKKSVPQPMAPEPMATALPAANGTRFTGIELPATS